MQIHSHRSFRKAAQRGNLSARISLDQAQQQRLAVSLRQGLNGRNRFLRSKARVQHVLTAGMKVPDFDFVRMPPEVVDGALAGDRADPAGERTRFSQRVDLCPCLEEDFLGEIGHAIERHMRQQDGVHETAKPVIKRLERILIATLRCDHDGTVILERLFLRRQIQKSPFGLSRIFKRTT